MSDNKYLVMDFGGTFIKYGLADDEAHLLEQDKIPSVRDNQDAFFASLEPVFAKYRGKIKGCAVSMPGRIDTKNGIAITAGALTRIFKDVPVGPIISEKLGVPVTVGNDGKCAAAAELWTGALKDVENGAALVFGTAIAGGIIINHRIYMGSSWTAGELSNVIYDGPAMYSGFLEAKNFHEYLASGKKPFWWASASATSITYEYSKAKGLNPENAVSGEEVFEAYRNGDKDAIKVLKDFAEVTAVGIMSLQAVLDLEAVAIGGGISAAPELVPLVADTVHDLWIQQKRSYPCLEPRIVKCVYGNDANLLGALKLHLDEQGG